MLAFLSALYPFIRKYKPDFCMAWAIDGGIQVTCPSSPREAVLPVSDRSGKDASWSPFGVSSKSVAYWSQNDSAICVIDLSTHKKRWVSLSSLGYPSYVDMRGWSDSIVVNTSKDDGSQLVSIVVPYGNGPLHHLSVDVRSTPASTDHGERGADGWVTIRSEHGDNLRAAQVPNNMSWDFSPQGWSLAFIPDLDGLTHTIHIIRRGGHTSSARTPIGMGVDDVAFSPDAGVVLVGLAGSFSSGFNLMAYKADGTCLGTVATSDRPFNDVRCLDVQTGKLLMDLADTIASRPAK
jgi:hypothetical protein